MKRTVEMVPQKYSTAIQNSAVPSLKNRAKSRKKQNKKKTEKCFEPS